jgi:hypothetical protein
VNISAKLHPLRRRWSQLKFSRRIINMCAFKCDSCFHKQVCVGSPSVEPITQDCALYTNVENFNSLQQLKAEIAKVAKVFEDKHSSYREMRDALDKLWQLSAI